MDVSKRYAIEIEKFGRRLRQIRKGKNLSQLDLELLSNIARTEISRIENGEKNIEFFTLVKLAQALNVSIHEFFKE
jgi:transcriptional regulator with XRE-family HTH domain